MGSSRDGRPGDLDTSQPGVRQIQAWIRAELPLALQLSNGSNMSGRPL